MSIDRLLGYVIQAIEHNAEKKHNPNEVKGVHSFEIERNAKSLLMSAKKKAEHHREREQHYKRKLEEAEKELRDKGVSVDLVNAQGVGLGYNACVASGAPFANVSQSNYNPSQLKYEARVDQKLMDAVKVAKDKAQYHFDQAISYEKWARAFSVCPADKIVKLSVEDIHYFGLEN